MRGHTSSIISTPFEQMSSPSQFTMCRVNSQCMGVLFHGCLLLGYLYHVVSCPDHPEQVKIAFSGFFYLSMMNNLCVDAPDDDRDVGAGGGVCHEIIRLECSAFRNQSDFASLGYSTRRLDSFRRLRI
mmetsp:Transcript_9089/g.19184  ORF Transcript_9089/g.19184 Transcript_9089/m.19184 type:complete len:128 (+) Transcript_9089:2080-2463(+)